MFACLGGEVAARVGLNALSSSPFTAAGLLWGFVDKFYPLSITVLPLPNLRLVQIVGFFTFDDSGDDANIMHAVTLI